ncbi:MAG: hypothetical protein WCJ89_01310 [Actinomycetes bacterium]
MESLAVVVAILFLIAIISGPIAIGISRIKTRSFIGLIFKRILHGLFILMGTMVGGQWILIPGLPLFARIVGVGSIYFCYIASRNEYFPEFRVFAIITEKINALLARKDLKTIPVRKRTLENKAVFGPAAKWRNGGRSSGRDGHGPGGQH